MREKETTDWDTIRLFWRTIMLTKRSLLVRSLLFPIGTVGLSTFAPLYVGKILATLGRKNLSPDHYVIYFCISAILGVLCNRYGFTAFLQLQATAMQHLQELSLSALFKRSVGFHNNNVGGKLVSDAIDIPSGFGQFINVIVTSIMPLSMTVISGTIVVLIASWELGLVIIAMTVVAIGSGIYESRRRSGLRKKRLMVTKELTGHLADSILNVQTVKTFARENDEMRTHHKLGERLKKLRLHDWTQAGIKGNNRIAALLVMQLVFVLVILHLIKKQPDLLGVGIFAFSFTITLSNRLFDINNMIRGIEDSLLLAAPMTTILMQDAEIKDKPGAKRLAHVKGEIELHNVTFEYRDEQTAQTVFEHLNLTIQAGEKIGLVGPSGGGKSTLTRLLLRFEDIADGSIRIDEQNIADVTQASLRQSISYVPQEPLLFHRSVHENIAYGNPDATLEHIQKAARMAHADEFIEKLKDGYETIVGERGVKLSGGQRQRIAIARAILKNSPILILDEATSALDSESEVLIQDALWKLMEKRTAIVIAHRLSTIQKMDRIIVLDNGAIAEEGTHQELLERKGLYAKLWAHQSGGFIEE